MELQSKGCASGQLPTASHTGQLSCALPSLPKIPLPQNRSDDNIWILTSKYSSIQFGELRVLEDHALEREHDQKEPAAMTFSTQKGLLIHRMSEIKTSPTLT